MIKSLSTLVAVMVVSISANAQQVTQSTTVTEVVPKQTTTTQAGAVVTEVVPQQVITEVVPQQVITEVVPATPPTTVTGRTTTTTTVQRFDPAVAQRHLSVTPVTVTITPEQRAALNRTVVIESQPEPVRRIYNLERNVVIVEDQGQSREYSYVTVPVLFVVDTAELLDAESREALAHTAAVIKEVSKTNPDAMFDVEGHTSTEGSAEHNLRLSVERSQRIYAELTQRYDVPASSLTAHGYGQNFAMYPNGTERERQEDRRVLVVRTR